MTGASVSPRFRLTPMVMELMTQAIIAPMDIRCAASDGNPNVWDIPVLRGRGAVPLEALAEAITKTVEEQDQVVAALKMGVAGPYIFAEASWDKPSDSLGF